MTNSIEQEEGDLFVFSESSNQINKEKSKSLRLLALSFYGQQLFKQYNTIAVLCCSKACHQNKKIENFANFFGLTPPLPSLLTICTVKIRSGLFLLLSSAQSLNLKSVGHSLTPPPIKSQPNWHSEWSFSFEGMPKQVALCVSWVN